MKKIERLEAARLGRVTPSLIERGASMNANNQIVAQSKIEQLEQHLADLGVGTARARYGDSYFLLCTRAIPGSTVRQWFPGTIPWPMAKVWPAGPRHGRMALERYTAAFKHLVDRIETRPPVICSDGSYYREPERSELHFGWCLYEPK